MKLKFKVTSLRWNSLGTMTGKGAFEKKNQLPNSGGKDPVFCYYANYLSFPKGNTEHILV